MAHLTVLSLSLLLLAVRLSQAQVLDPSSPNLKDLENKTFLISASHPLRTALRPVMDTIPPLLDHISFISQAAQTSAEAARKNNSTPTITTCNYRTQNDMWTKKVLNYFLERSWGDVDDDCVTDVYGAGIDDGVRIVGSKDPGSDSRTIFGAVVDHGKAVDSIAKKAEVNAELKWPGATRATDFRYSVRTQTCDHEYAGFVRIGGDWYITERVTNDDKDLTLGEGERQYIQEYVRVADGQLFGKEMRARLENKEEFDTGTTTLFKSTGPVTGAEFREIFAPDNLAVREALRAGDHSTQQASDATTPSNIAILALPLAMNVVPVALIADVNTAGMLVYTLLTDVLTTIPLLIKGVEVLSIGVDTNVAVVTRVTGANVDDDQNKAGEVWVAECRANGDLTATGVVLIVVAVGFMVGGVVAEILARRWVKRRGGSIGGKASAGLVMAGVAGRGKERGEKNV